MLNLLEEKKKIYFIMRTMLSYFKLKKPLENLTWLDKLTGVADGYIKTYKIYLKFLDVKKLQKRKKVLKFKKKKNNYFILLKKD